MSQVTMGIDLVGSIKTPDIGMGVNTRIYINKYAGDSLTLMFFVESGTMRYLFSHTYYICTCVHV